MVAGVLCCYISQHMRLQAARRILIIAALAALLLCTKQFEHLHVRRFCKPNSFLSSNCRRDRCRMSAFRGSCLDITFRLGILE
jgi:hypothetical protein